MTHDDDASARSSSDIDPVHNALSDWRADDRRQAFHVLGEARQGRRSIGQCIFCTVSRLFRPNRRTSLVESWLPALEGVLDKLKAGARVADLGCSHGHSTLIMAEAFPRSEFIGYDSQAAAIDIACRHVARHRATNLRFEAARAWHLPERRFDLVTCFEWLQHEASPLRVARGVRQALVDDGTWMIVEPGYLADLPVQHPSGNGLVCSATDLRATIAEAGFRSIRQVAETPFSTILEARL